jgi:hypothetical protein
MIEIITQIILPDGLLNQFFIYDTGIVICIKNIDKIQYINAQGG